jgi:GntR family transcriptional repressor for pyruvate dehydrogenase complex
MRADTITMPLASQDSRSLTDDVAAQLRAAIQAGGHLPGERLPTEAVLGSQLKVSRSVLREALSQLKAEGLIVSQQGRG